MASAVLLFATVAVVTTITTSDSDGTNKHYDDTSNDEWYYERLRQNGNTDIQLRKVENRTETPTGHPTLRPTVDIIHIHPLIKESQAFVGTVDKMEEIGERVSECMSGGEQVVARVNEVALQADEISESAKVVHDVVDLAGKIPHPVFKPFKIASVALRPIVKVASSLEKASDIIRKSLIP